MTGSHHAYTPTHFTNGTYRIHRAHGSQPFPGWLQRLALDRRCQRLQRGKAGISARIDCRHRRRRHRLHRRLTNECPNRICFFDAQCPHCSELWRTAKPLKSQAKFIWIPVGILNAASTSQGATLLASKDPVALMDEHEASILAKGSGISSASDIATQKDAVAKNTQLLNRFGFASIPTIVGTHAETGALVTNEGAMSTVALASLLGLQAPAAPTPAPLR